MVYSLRTKEGKYNKNRKALRHIQIAIDVAEFDNSKLVTQYATIWLRHGFVHSSLKEAAEQCALDLKDPGARLNFRREVKRLRRYFHTDE